MCQGSFGRWSNQSPMGNARLHTGLTKQRENILDAKNTKTKNKTRVSSGFVCSCLQQVFHGWKENKRAGCIPLKVQIISGLKSNWCSCESYGNFSNRTFTTNSLCFPQVHLTYLTLPWWHIVKDILETRESSMLTF